MPMLVFFPSSGIYGELMVGDLRVESGHLSCTPYEQINILKKTRFELLPR